MCSFYRYVAEVEDHSWTMAFLKFKGLHRNSIIAMENHLSLGKCPPNFW